MPDSRRPRQVFKNLAAKIAAIPMILTATVVFVGGTLWTVLYSFTDSKLLPRENFVGLAQYERLWSSSKWIISIQNLAIYGILSLIFSMVIGFLLAALMDQKIRFEDGFRTIINTGRVGHQEVYHVHMHVLGGPEPLGPMLSRRT